MAWVSPWHAASLGCAYPVREQSCCKQTRCSIVVSTSACRVEDPRSIPGGRVVESSGRAMSARPLPPSCASWLQQSQRPRDFAIPPCQTCKLGSKSPRLITLKTSLGEFEYQARARQATIPARTKSVLPMQQIRCSLAGRPSPERPGRQPQ